MKILWPVLLLLFYERTTLVETLSWWEVMKGAVGLGSAASKAKGKMVDRLDCYAGVGIRAGGCAGNDVRNHEMRLTNLESSGRKTFIYTRKVGDQVDALHKVADHHQSAYESHLFKKGPKSAEHQRQQLIRSRKILHNFPTADLARERAEKSWHKTLTERVLQPRNALDYIEIVLGLTIITIVSAKVLRCVKNRHKRKEQSVHSLNICTAPAPPTAVGTANV